MTDRTISEAAEPPTVRTGQVWSDNHPGEQGQRKIEVLTILRGVVVRERLGDYAEVVVRASRHRGAVGRRTWIRLDRFNPNRQTGYTLIKDATTGDSAASSPDSSPDVE